MRKERNLRYQMRKKGYQFNREQRVAILPEDSKNRSAVQENDCEHWGMIFSTICFKVKNMSVKNDIIKVTPPAFVGVGNLKETIISTGHLCRYCHGNGSFWGEELRERVKKDCPVCNGSGKLDAVITIEWKPSKQ